MSTDFFKKGLSLLTKRQTNILSAAIIIMATIVFSQILGLVRQRLLVSIFGASNLLGVYLYGIQLPDALFQVVIAGALYSAFIPVFSDFLSKDDEKDAHKFASTLLVLCLIIFTVISIILFIFAPFFLQIFNLGGKSTPAEMMLMANIMRLVIFGQLLFIVGSFFAAILQSYNRFLIPGFAAALYNLGIIIGIVLLSPSMGIYAPAVGIVIGAGMFMLLQVPFIKQVGFAFVPTFSFFTPGIMRVLHLMWPRTISIGIFQIGALIMVALISFIPNPGRNRVIFDYAQTLSFAPVALFGQAIAQAAFPILSKEREKVIRIKTIAGYKLTAVVYLGVSVGGEQVSPTPSISLTATPSAAVSTPKAVILDTPTGFLRVRAASSSAGVEVARVNPGESFDILEEGDEWYRIALPDGKNGWVSKQYAQKQ